MTDNDLTKLSNEDLLIKYSAEVATGFVLEGGYDELLRRLTLVERLVVALKRCQPRIITLSDNDSFAIENILSAAIACEKCGHVQDVEFEHPQLAALETRLSTAEAEVVRLKAFTCPDCARVENNAMIKLATANRLLEAVASMRTWTQIKGYAHGGELREAARAHLSPAPAAGGLDRAIEEISQAATEASK